MDVQQRQRRQLEKLRDRFVAATLRTRSLRLRRLSRRGAVDLSRLARKDSSAFDRVLRGLGAGDGEAVALCDIQPVDELEAFEDDVAVLAHAAREERLETGRDALAVGWPFVEGATAEGTWVRAPVLLFPVAVETDDKGRIQWMLRPTGSVRLNEPLVEFFAREQGFRIQQKQLFKDRSPTVSEASWCRIGEQLNRLDLPLVSVLEKLPEFEEVSRRASDESAEAKQGSFELHNHVVLGRFPASASNVVADYDRLLERWGEQQQGTLAAKLLEVDEPICWEREDAPTGERSRRDCMPGDWRRWQLFASDASQDSVFRFIEEAGEEPTGLVVQGPPGTGKSQLIANLVGAAIARNQRVLVVCPKRAGLDVVASRLDSAGLGEPLAVVHDVASDRNAICGSIEKTLDQLDDHLAGAESRRLQQQRARQEHQQALQRLDSRLEHSRETFQRLSCSQQGKPPLAHLQEQLLDDDGRPLPEMASVAEEVSRQDLYDALPRIETLAAETAELARPHPLWIRGRFEQFDAGDFDELFDNVEQLQTVVESARTLTEATMPPGESARHASLWDDVAPLVEMLEGQGASPQEFLMFWTWTGGEAETGEWNRVMERLEEARRQLALTPHGLITQKRDRLERWIQQLQQFEELQQYWYRFVLPEYWRLRGVPQQVMDCCGGWFEEDSKLPTDLQGMCSEAIAWQELILAMPGDNPLFDFGFSGRPGDIERAIESLQQHHTLTRCVHRLREELSTENGLYDQLPDIHPGIDRPARQVEMFRAVVADRALARSHRKFHQRLQKLSGEGLGAEVCRQLKEWFDGGDFDAILEQLRRFVSHRSDVGSAVQVDRLLSEEPEWVRYFLRRWRPENSGTENPGEDAELAMQRGWCQVLAGGRHPAELEAPLVDDEYLHRLAQDLKRCRRLAADGVQGRYVHRLTEAAGDDRLRRALQQLGAEVGKRRNKPSLRQLTERFWDRGLALLRPVWFCSPEAVSALFSADPDQFDLVIFDEASQCPVESAIPALARSRCAIIAGDDQQMPPSRFFQARPDLEQEGSILLSTPSILQLARASLATTTLRWHYRSRHEELIAFSNRAFYAGKLATAPEARPKRTPDVDGLHHRRVDGLWEERQNRSEAEEVVELVEQLLAVENGDQSSPTVGVVTFNRRQAELIEHLVDVRAAERASFRRALRRDEQRPGVDQLFVRNLENVQGDQRDVIIISPGYAPEEPGEPVPARFGPISRQGGGKRLNVAITRARRGVWLVTSMDPQSLEVEHTKHAGPKLLRAYLGFVAAHAACRHDEVQRWLNEAERLGRGEGAVGTSTPGGPGRGPGRRVCEQLAAELKRRGLVVEQEVGLGSQRLDLSVRAHSDDPARVGIDCTEYLRNPDTLARDVYGPAFWRRAGWQVLRISPRMWMDEREATLQRIIDAVHVGDNESNQFPVA